MNATCPECGSDQWTDIEYKGVHTSPLFRVCNDCGHAFPRRFATRRLTDLSVRYAAGYDRLGQDDRRMDGES